MPKRPKYNPADDEPKVGQIWRCEEIAMDGRWCWVYFLLTEEIGEHTFAMLNMNSGDPEVKYMNFELEDWRWVA
jgi:transposase-like protein